MLLGQVFLRFVHSVRWTGLVLCPWPWLFRGSKAPPAEEKEERSEQEAGEVEETIPGDCRVCKSPIEPCHVNNNQIESL